ncbi:MAG TPA: DJ-1/PfpI family protein [Syntrophomonas sp.]|nr:DJ-1/PfpI family protein [Syntrophomonas sp.]
MNFNVVLFHEFETLDAFGPVEVIGKLEKDFKIEFYSLHGGVVQNSNNVRVETLPMSDMEEAGILLIPGGAGIVNEVQNQELIQRVRELALHAAFVLTVCTGSALLAKTGLLKNKFATSNKRLFDWVAGQDKEVQWMRTARWVRDGKFYTSSGVSAGIDMTLGFISDIIGMETAQQIATRIEYSWNRDNEYYNN